MKKLLLVISICTSASLYGQTPTDAVMMKQRQLCLAVIYDRGAWDHYWEGSELRTNANVGTLNRRMILPMLAIGLHDKLNLIVSLPHVKTESSDEAGGRMHGASGLQDIGFNLKGEAFKKEIGKGKMSLLGNVGFSTPMTNYLSDYQPYSIGSGAPELSLRGIAQYRLDNGFYVLTSLAHLWRGATEIERDYYYNNGSFYTNKMDVPNAWNFNGAVGVWLLKGGLKLEATYMSSICTSGDDIRKYNAGQPTNKVEVGQVGFNTQFYIKKIEGLGLLAYYTKMISGRNMGEFTNIGAGVTYQFKL